MPLSRFRNLGVSLIEMMIVLALLGSVGLGVGVLISKGVNFYLDTSDSIQVRKQLVVGASRLAREINDSQIGMVKIYPDGLVFPSLRDGSGQFHYDERGRSLWQKYVCYYVEDPSAFTAVPPGTTRLLKKEVVLPGGTDSEIAPDPDSETPPIDVTWFRSNNAIPISLIARDVKNFSSSKGTDLVEFELEISNTTRREHSLSIKSSAKPSR